MAAGGLTPAFRETLAKGLRLVLFLTLPCAVGLSILAGPIISVIFEHGKFTAFDVTQCAAALEAYAFGLIFYAGIKVVQPAFYAIDRRFFPMCVGLGVIAFNVSLNSITVFVLHWGHAALAWATAAGLMLNFFALLPRDEEIRRGTRERKARPHAGAARGGRGGARPDLRRGAALALRGLGTLSVRFATRPARHYRQPRRLHVTFT